MSDEVRLIDANALKRAIELLCEDERTNMTAITYFTLRELLDTMPTIKAESDSGWVSIKDRKPENDGKYMVWHDELDICEFDAESQTFGYTYEDYDDMCSHLVCWDNYINESVTHWMYLPESPESEVNAE